MSRVIVPAPAATLMALLAVAMAATAAAGAGSSTICDTAKCGKGNCIEVPGLIPLLNPGYKCNCDPGWHQQKLNNLTVHFMPCVIPDCYFSRSCFNLTLVTPPPRGLPLTDPCFFIDCGKGGRCEKGAGMSYQCRCQPGFKNLLNDTATPCIGGSCTFAADCAKLGLGNTPVAPAPAPVGNDLYYY